MPRTVWKGALSFGLVNVAVALYPATQDRTLHFNQFEAGTSDRIRYKKVNERTGKEVPAAEIVKGYELGGGEYVLLGDDELEAAEPSKSKLIELTDFVDLDQIDPVFFRSTYYLAPAGDAASKAYALLRKVMGEADKVAIGTVVMRNQEHPVAVRANGEILELQTMYFADEIRPVDEVLPELPTGEDVTDRELQMATLLLESMESDWDPEKYQDTHRQQLEAVIEAKRLGDQVVTGVEQAPPSTKVVDLMEVLSASVDSVRSTRRGSIDGEPAPRKRAAKQPATAKKSAGTAKPKAPGRRRAS